MSSVHPGWRRSSSTSTAPTTCSTPGSPTPSGTCRSTEPSTSRRRRRSSEPSACSRTPVAPVSSSSAAWWTTVRRTTSDDGACATRTSTRSSSAGTAPVAQRFYEASPADPMGVELKRVFTEEERRLVRVVDEIVGAAAAAATDATGLGKAFSDALLNELDRSRDGAMRDVVATIQAEQFAVIRAASDRVIVVEGGPGTGKTVVGLHRAAWLAFNHEALRRTGVLVVAPSTTFLTYVAGVLPSLDVTDVDQVEVQRLYAGEADVRGEDDDTAGSRGAPAMATVLANARSSSGSGGATTTSCSTSGAIASRCRRRRPGDRSTTSAPATCRTTTAARSSGPASPRWPSEQHREDAARRRADRCGPTRPRSGGSPPSPTRSTGCGRPSRPRSCCAACYGTQTWLVARHGGLLTADERAAPLPPDGRSPWPRSPGRRPTSFCLDEVAALLNRDVVTYGHLVVDEAQDLSPMQAPRPGPPVPVAGPSPCWATWPRPPARGCGTTGPTSPSTSRRPATEVHTLTHRLPGTGPGARAGRRAARRSPASASAAAVHPAGLPATPVITSTEPDRLDDTVGCRASTTRLGEGLQHRRSGRRPVVRPLAAALAAAGDSPAATAGAATSPPADPRAAHAAARGWSSTRSCSSSRPTSPREVAAPAPRALRRHDPVHPGARGRAHRGAARWVPRPDRQDAPADPESSRSSRPSEVAVPRPGARRGQLASSSQRNEPSLRRTDLLRSTASSTPGRGDVCSWSSCSADARHDGGPT